MIISYPVFGNIRLGARSRHHSGGLLFISDHYFPGNADDGGEVGDGGGVGDSSGVTVMSSAFELELL
jgi:hypothetical protein